MPLILRHRRPELREQMDDPACNLSKLEATYAHFAIVNRIFSGWWTLYRQHLRPHLVQGRTNYLLDVGFGGGDIPRRLLAWAERDGLELSIKAIDPDPRAAAFAHNLPPQLRLSFEQTDTSTVRARGDTFDVVVSNHLLHHLSNEEVKALCDDSAALGRVVLHNDIARADVAYAGFAALTSPFFRGSYITPDGLTSVLRSYTSDELRAITPPGWHISSPYPYRLLLSYGLDAPDV